MRHPFRFIIKSNRKNAEGTFLYGAGLAVLMAASAPNAAFSQESIEVSTMPVADYRQTRAPVIRDIRVEGNQRIETRTVLSYFGMKPGDSFEQSEIDWALKNLFVTGFFSDVTLLRDGNILIIRVQENPVINRIAFEGNVRIDTADLEPEVQLQPRSIFSQEKVQNDVQRVLDIYRRSGRYNATVEPKLIEQSENRVDLVFEITEGPVAHVQKITFIGNEHYDSNTLREIVRTEESAWYKFFSDNDKYDPDRQLYDEELLRRFYSKEGYADFNVKSSNAQLSATKDAFFVTYVIEEGPRYTISDISIVNNLRDDSDGVDFKSMIIPKEGDTYNSEEVDNTVLAMTQELGNLGYAFVDIRPRLDRNRSDQTASLTFEIKPGPRVYVDRINITGNVRTLDEVVRREFRLKEGDPYNSAKLERTEQRLNNLGYFEQVSVENEPGSAPDRTVLNVDVKEKSTGEINLGAGFSTTDGILGDVGISERNLLGRGQELRANFTLAAFRQAAVLGFTEPYFLDRELSAGVDIFRTFLDFTRQSSFVSDNTGARFRLGYALQERLLHNVYYSFNQIKISDVPENASSFILRQEGNNVNSAIGQTFSYDTRDNRFNPTRGYFLSLTQELAGLGGNSEYLKHDVRASYYKTLYPKFILGFLGSGGVILGKNDESVFINDRFFLGGDDFRGFQNAGIGPRDANTTDALGGRKYYLGTAELRFPLGLPEEIGVTGAVFTDVGSLWDTPEKGANVFDSNAVRVVVGAGVLWSSPFGPIRVDLGYAATRQQQDRPQTLRFGFGQRF